jgi:hypothetical protein
METPEAKAPPSLNFTPDEKVADSIRANPPDKRKSAERLANPKVQAPKTMAAPPMPKGKTMAAPPRKPPQAEGDGDDSQLGAPPATARPPTKAKAKAKSKANPKAAPKKPAAKFKGLVSTLQTMLGKYTAATSGARTLVEEMGSLFFGASRFHVRV